MDVCILSRRSRRYKKRYIWEDDMLIMDRFDGQLTVCHIDWHKLMANNNQVVTMKPLLTLEKNSSTYDQN